MCRSFTYLVRQIEGNALDSQMYVAEDGCQFGIHGKELDKLLLPFIPRCFFHFPPEMFGYYSTPSLYLQRQLTFHAGGCHNDVDRTIWGMQL